MIRTGRHRHRNRKPKKQKPQPTPEMLKRRAELAQGGDPVLTSSPLGCCKARALIGNGDYFAGIKYAILYKRLLDRPIHPKSVNLDGRRQGPLIVEERVEVEHEKTYREANKALGSAGPKAYQTVQDIAVFEHWPAFLTEGMTRHQMDSGEVRSGELEALQDGLDALAQHFGMTP